MGRVITVLDYIRNRYSCQVEQWIQNDNKIFISPPNKNKKILDFLIPA